MENEQNLMLNQVLDRIQWYLGHKFFFILGSLIVELKFLNVWTDVYVFTLPY